MIRREHRATQGGDQPWRWMLPPRAGGRSDGRYGPVLYGSHSGRLLAGGPHRVACLAPGGIFLSELVVRWLYYAGGSVPAGQHVRGRVSGQAASACQGAA